MQVVRFVGACCELPEGLTSAMQASARSGGGGGGLGGHPAIPPSLVRGVKLAIVMEL